MFPQFPWLFSYEAFACVRLPWRGDPHTSAELTNDSRSSMGMQQVAFPLPDGSHSYKERRASAPIQRAGVGVTSNAQHMPVTPRALWQGLQHCHKASVSQVPKRSWLYKAQAVLSRVSKRMAKALRNFYRTDIQECTWRMTRGYLEREVPGYPS